MIKILLVDDDFLVRTYLSRLTNWEAHGYTLVGTAQDGEQALQMVEEFQPEIIITDLTMPILDGITLIRRLKQAGNTSKIIVLSCHDDFEYVKEAMKLGADEYVLKNLLTEDSMLKLLDEIKGSVVQQSGPDINPEREWNSILRQLRGESGEDNVASGFCIHAALAIRIVGYEDHVTNLSPEQQEKFQSSFLQVCREACRDTHIIRGVHVRQEQYAVVFDLSREESRGERRKRLQQASVALVQYADRYLGVSVIIGVSDTPDFQTDAAMRWREAVDALGESFYSRESVFYAWETRQMGQTLPQAARAFCDSIAQMIEEKNEDGIRGAYAEALEAFRREHTRAKLVREWLAQADQEAGVETRVMPEYFSDFYGMEQAYLLFCEEKLPEAEQYSEAVVQTIRYIQTHYAEGISLSDAAEAVHLNAAYLSFLFHKETDITFSEYLLSCRMNRAKELLVQTNDKIRDIGLQTGYRDHRHFCKTFKKVTGMTPQEYRKQRGSGK